MASSLLSPSSAAAASTLPDVVVEGYIGIDIGTQGLSVLFTDSTDLKVLAKGDAAYGYSKEENGCYEQLTSYWEDALQHAMLQVRQQIIMPLQNVKLKVLAIGISGQMHGEVLLKNADDDTTNMNDDVSHNEETAADDACVVSFAPVRLWCDARNGEEGDELTVAFGVKVPKRASCARFL
jgi:sugar (pentulose or hexulose) kinase